MFSSDVKGITNNGSSISIIDGNNEITQSLKSIETPEPLTFYEYEILNRLSDLIASFIHSKTHVNVLINIPKTEYYFFLLNAYNEGLVSTELMSAYINKVNLRSELLKNLFSQLITNKSQLSKNISFELTTINVLDQLGSAIESKIHQSEKVRLRFVKDFLISQVYSKYPKCIENKCLAQSLKSFQSIGNFSYVLAELSALCLNSNTTIALEDYREEYIFSNTNLFLKNLPDDFKNLVGFYSYPTEKDNSVTHLYESSSTPTNRMIDYFKQYI